MRRWYLLSRSPKTTLILSSCIKYVLRRLVAFAVQNLDQWNTRGCEGVDFPKYSRNDLKVSVGWTAWFVRNLIKYQSVAQMTQASSARWSLCALPYRPDDLSGYDPPKNRKVTWRYFNLFEPQSQILVYLYIFIYSRTYIRSFTTFLFDCI